MIRRAEPNAEQAKVMADYADLCSKIIETLCRYEVNLDSQQAMIKIRESLNWFHSFILNGGQLAPIEKAPDDSTIN